jgi:4-hydroxybenzoate polyprenyltransferase
MSQNQQVNTNQKYNYPLQPNVVERLLGSIVYSSVFISCCAFSLTVETYKLTGLSISTPMAAFVFFATLFTYNLSSIYSFLKRPNQKKYKESEQWLQRNKKLLAIAGTVSIIAAVGIYLYFNLSINFWVVFHLALISVGYTVPIVYKSDKVWPLRNIPLLKVFLIAYVWAVVTALFPVMDAGIATWDTQTILLVFRRFLFILALALLFDIRDYAYDRHMKTLTIPGYIGVRNTKLISVLMLTVYALIVIVTETGIIQWALITGTVVAAMVVLFADEHKPRVYYAILADGAMLVHAGLVYLAFTL